MGYTWAQFTAYLHQARRRGARQQLEQLLVMGNAFAGGDGLKAMLKRLTAAAQ